MNDFQQRRHAENSELSDSIEGFRDYRFEDEQAGEDFQQLLDELDRQRQLEKFLEQRGDRFRGAEQADYETAQQVRERIEGIEQLARDLAQGNFEQITPEMLQEMLGDEAARSFILLRDLESSLERRGYLRQSGDELTPRAIRKIGANALAEVYGALRKDRLGGHETDVRGAAIPRPDETKAFEFGDPLDLDVVRTMMNSIRRMSAVDVFLSPAAGASSNPAAGASSSPAAGKPLRLNLDVADFEIREFDYTTQTTTVLLLDMSWSMSWAGRFAAAKRVALALTHLIRTQFPGDSLRVVLFHDSAEEIPLSRLAHAQVGPFHTNTAEGLKLARRLLLAQKKDMRQIIMITDGKPSALTLPDGRIYINSMGLDPRILKETFAEVASCRRSGIMINTFMLAREHSLVRFVQKVCEISRGKAYFTNTLTLGQYILMDYMRRKTKRV